MGINDVIIADRAFTADSIVAALAKPPAIRHCPGDFPIGIDIYNGNMVAVPGLYADCHQFTCGSTNSGKSYGLELQLARLLWLRKKCPDRGPGLLLIDPHGTLYDRMLKRLVEAKVPAEDVILIELDARDCLPSFQPLARHGSSIDYQVAAFRQACLKVWGQEDLDQTPQLGRWLKNCVQPLIELGFSPAEFEHMLCLQDTNAFRDRVIAKCTSSSIKSAWRGEFKQLKTVLQRLERALGSVINRLEPYYECDHLRRLLGQANPTKVIDWRDVMDSGKIVLVKLTGGNLIHDDHVRLIGVLLLNEIVRASLRPPSRLGGRAFIVCVDEFQRVINRDFLRLLQETRKFRVFCWAACQDPLSIRELDPELYYAVLSNARDKLVFGGVSCEELPGIVTDGFASEFDPDAIKFDLDRTFFEPVESTRTIHSDSEGITVSEAVAHSEGITEGKTWSSVEGASSGMTVPVDGGFLPIDGTMSSSSSLISGEGGSKATSKSTTVIEGIAQSVAHTATEVPFTEQHERHELSSRQFRTLDEQLKMAIYRVHCLPNQHCCVIVPGRPPAIAKVFTLPEAKVTDEQVVAYRAAVFTNPCYSTPDEVDREIEERCRNFLKPPRSN